MTNNENAIVPVPQDDPEWQGFVNQIVEEMGSDLPDKVIEATELLLAGWPMYKVAKRIGAQTKTVRGWLETYPSMARAVANGRKLLSKWRMAKLEQQFYQAVEKSEEILDLDLTDREVNSKLVGVVAQHARYVISLFAGQKIDVNVTLNESDQTLKAKQDALDYLAQALQSQRSSGEPIEATFRVEDVKPAELTASPMLDQDGNPFYGQLGVLDVDVNGEGLCHICGNRYRSMKSHINKAHSMDSKTYELIFMLEHGTLLLLDSHNE